MDAWTALVISRQISRELQRDAARHRLARLAAAAARTPPHHRLIDSTAPLTLRSQL